jgi:PilZ domain-containing protein
MDLIDVSDQSVTPVERRTGERRPLQFVAVLHRADGGATPSFVRNVSESGALLLVRTRRVAVGDEICVDVQLGTSSERSLKGRVVRVEPVEDSLYWAKRVAVRFDERLPVSQLDRPS